MSRCALLACPTAWRVRKRAADRRLCRPLSARTVQVACCQLVGLVILVYCTRQLAPHISDVDTAMVGCGYAGVMGNKARARTCAWWSRAAQALTRFSRCAFVSLP